MLMHGAFGTVKIMNANFLERGWSTPEIAGLFALVLALGGGVGSGGV